MKAASRLIIAMDSNLLEDRRMNEIIDKLPEIKISTLPEDLLCYGFDASGIESFPSAVVWPGNTEGQKSNGKPKK